MYPSNNSLGLKWGDGAGRNRAALLPRCSPAFSRAQWRWPLVTHWRMSAPLVGYLQVAVLLLWHGVHWACAQSTPHGFDAAFMELWQMKHAGVPALV